MMACIIHVFASSPAQQNPFGKIIGSAGDASGGHAPAATKVILSWWKTTELLYSSPLFWQEDKGRFTPLTCLINVPRTGASLLEGGKASIKCASRDPFVFCCLSPDFWPGFLAFSTSRFHFDSRSRWFNRPFSDFSLLLLLLLRLECTGHGLLLLFISACRYKAEGELCFP